MIKKIVILILSTTMFYNAFAFNNGKKIRKDHKSIIGVNYGENVELSEKEIKEQKELRQEVDKKFKNMYKISKRSLSKKLNIKVDDNLYNWYLDGVRDGIYVKLWAKKESQKRSNNYGFNVGVNRNINCFLNNKDNSYNLALIKAYEEGRKFSDRNL